ncbi:hypothetical protein CDAR_509781 [Caerostris darwini]|uniref:Uncharacterized protein n=1 Tax=Caerostris darwini TaxID=1538125 RepID=A0AAV4QHG3_9ARAC|nr:hypothetical protein CDAR_509781 [Caerostris darwini]
MDVAASRCLGVAFPCGRQRAFNETDGAELLCVGKDILCPAAHAKCGGHWANPAPPEKRDPPGKSPFRREGLKFSSYFAEDGCGRIAVLRCGFPMRT